MERKHITFDVKVACFHIKKRLLSPRKHVVFELSLFAYTSTSLLDIYATILLQYLQCFFLKSVKGVFQYLRWGYNRL